MQFVREEESVEVEVPRAEVGAAEPVEVGVPREEAGAEDSAGREKYHCKYLHAAQG